MDTAASFFANSHHKNTQLLTCLSRTILLVLKNLPKAVASIVVSLTVVVFLHWIQLPNGSTCLSHIPFDAYGTRTKHAPRQNKIGFEILIRHFSRSKAKHFLVLEKGSYFLTHETNFISHHLSSNFFPNRFVQFFSKNFFLVHKIFQVEKKLSGVKPRIIGSPAPFTIAKYFEFIYGS